MICSVTRSVLPRQSAIGIEDELARHAPGVSDRSSLSDSLSPCLKAPLDDWGRKEFLQPSPLQTELLIELGLWITGKRMRRVHCLLELVRFLWLGLADEKDVPVWMGVKVLHLLPAEDAAQMAQKDHNHWIIPEELSCVSLLARAHGQDAGES